MRRLNSRRRLKSPQRAIKDRLREEAEDSFKEGQIAAVKTRLDDVATAIKVCSQRSTLTVDQHVPQKDDTLQTNNRGLKVIVIHEDVKMNKFDEWEDMSSQHGNSVERVVKMEPIDALQRPRARLKPNSIKRSFHSWHNYFSALAVRSALLSKKCVHLIKNAVANLVEKSTSTHMRFSSIVRRKPQRPWAVLEYFGSTSWRPILFAFNSLNAAKKSF